ncbi:zincin-like metallopeptidase domain-containing protein (plasmid) [Vibrio alfacsensis]|uniref:ArdC family protein n=1 Tax=Vibrio alfacsensis TaxID=1074311 RepID=UPI002ADE1714|nr:zincin-like metallopeptidase domain-containing protein [Vibrio alfacsensis]WQE79486.1 zincin-like metallopeptidase domain-containing protein [Vibrio alfacsensis]
MATYTKSSTDFYQTITNQIIQALEAGIKPWVCPWDRTQATGLPINASTHQPYQGMNIMLLWMSAAERNFSSPYWLTFKQAKDLGGKVRKGEKGTTIFFYKMVQKKEAENEKDDVYPMLKTYTVFNLDQIDGFSLEQDESSTLRHEIELLEEVEAFIEATQADITYGGQKAFFRPSTDIVVIPDRERFHSTADLYATIMHELTHWSGHESRLGRDMKGEFGSKDYAQEELVAELGSAFLMASFGVVGEVQHESYIANWLEALKNDKRYIFKAATHASKAHQYLLSFHKEFSVDIEQA